MAKYAVSPEGAESLRDLSARVNGYIEGIREAGDTLKNGISGLSGLGLFEDKILEVVAEIERLQNQGEQAVQTVSDKLTNKADEIEAILNSGLINL